MSLLMIASCEDSTTARECIAAVSRASAAASDVVPRVAVTPPMGCRKRRRRPLFELHAVGPEIAEGNGTSWPPMASRRADTQPEPRRPRIAARRARPLSGIQPGSGNHESSTTRRCRLRQESCPGIGAAHRRQAITCGKKRVTLRMMDLAHLPNGSAQHRPYGAPRQAQLKPSVACSHRPASATPITSMAASRDGEKHLYSGSNAARSWLVGAALRRGNARVQNNVTPIRTSEPHDLSLRGRLLARTSRALCPAQPYS